MKKLTKEKIKYLINKNEIIYENKGYFKQMKQYMNDDPDLENAFKNLQYLCKNENDCFKLIYFLTEITLENGLDYINNIYKNIDFGTKEFLKYKDKIIVLNNQLELLKYLYNSILNKPLPLEIYIFFEKNQDCLYIFKNYMGGEKGQIFLKNSKIKYYYTETKSNKIDKSFSTIPERKVKKIVLCNC